MKKDEILKIIDDVMNNREIDSIRNAILAIRDKVIEFEDDEIYDWQKDYVADLELRGGELCTVEPYFEGANRVRIDTFEKVDSGIYGTISYYKNET